MCLSGYDQKCTLCMQSHAYPNVLNERDPGRQSGAPVGIDPGSLSLHRALISRPPACLSSLSSPFQKRCVAHEICGHIDQLIESYCLEPWVVIEEGITKLLFCARVSKSAPLSSLSQHTLPSARLRFAAVHKSTHTWAHRAHTAAYTISVAQTTACIDCLPSAIMFLLFTFQHLTHSNRIQ